MRISVHGVMFVVNVLHVHTTSLLLLLPGAELSSWKFWPSQDLFLFSSILDAGYPVFDLHLAKSCLMLSSHLYLGLPCDLLVRGFQLNIFLTVLVSGILYTWPNQLSLWTLMWLIIFLCFISLSNSSFVLSFHIWFSFVGANILLKIFLPKTNNFWIMASRNTHVSDDLNLALLCSMPWAH
jgi:hypothetical protein